MTDLATKAGSDESSPDDDPVVGVDEGELDADTVTDDTDLTDDVASEIPPADERDASDLDDADATDADETEGPDAAATAVLTATDAPAPADETVPVEPLSADETLPHGSSAADDAAYAWAPAEPPKRRRRTPMWIGIGAGAALVGLVAASLVLIAPGASVAGVSVGGLTPGGAAEALSQRLAETTVVITGDGGDAVVTGADLGASVDAKALAEAAFAEHPAWNPTQWFPAPVDATVEIDEATADAALRTAVPDLYVDPTDATLAYDAATAMYVTTPASAGEGIDVEAVRAALQDAYDSGESRVEFAPVASPIEPATTTETAEATAATLNGILGTAGFYVGEERTVPIDRATAASWLTVTQQGDGTFAIAADETAIQAVVDTLAPAVNREVVNATVITNSAGGVLSAVTPGVAGRALGDTANVASDYAAQLANGNGVYQLPVEVKDFATTALARRIEVDISEQRAYLFENGAVVNSYYISSGLPGHDTNMGHFKIYAKRALQDMGDREHIKADYFTPNVPWISYFNGDEALHGAYWHHNFGHRMSHGCVNMPIDAAKVVYDWAPIGTEVWVHA